MRRVPSAAGGIRSRCRSHCGRADVGAALDAGRSVARRIYQGDARPVKRYFAMLLLCMSPIACVEVATAPGVCPTFCPNGTIESYDTIFTDIIVRDSAFRGYVQPYQAEAMTAADLPGVIDSRAVFVTNNMFTTTTPIPGDTTSVPLVADSVRLRTIIVRRDTQSTNLQLKLYSVPVTTDSTSTFLDLEPYFSNPPVDSVNVSAVLARPP